jgi:threonine dehydrogenase-like Zn-dependent dehydrogenase
MDAVGTEAHGTSLDALYDRAKHAVGLGTDRSHVLRQAIQACRKGGTVSVPGVFGGLLDKVPVGAAFAKALPYMRVPSRVHRYMAPLLAHIEAGRLDPSFIISHDRWPLSAAPEAYRMFRDKTDDCVKVVMDPWR